MKICCTAVLASLVLLGCSSLSYKEPVTGERARVRFASQDNGVVVLRGYDDASCTINEQEWMRLRSGYLVNSNPKRIGVPLWRFHENGAKEVYVDTRRSFNGLITGSEGDVQGLVTTTYQCGVAFSFDFKPDRDYEVEYFWKRRACTVAVSQIEDAMGSPKLTRVATFENRALSSNSKCIEAFKKWRLF